MPGGMFVSSGESSCSYCAIVQRRRIAPFVASTRLSGTSRASPRRCRGWTRRWVTASSARSMTRDLTWPQCPSPQRTSVPSMNSRVSGISGLLRSSSCDVTVLYRKDRHGQFQEVLAWVATIGVMLRPDVCYARADDGVAIAYSVVGDGPVTIVVVSPLISQLEAAWEEPALEHFWSRFAA